MSNEYILRELKEADYDSGYVECVNELTEPVDIDKETFIERFNELKNKKDYYIAVVEDSKTGKIVGSGTILLEYKFINLFILYRY